MLFHDQLVALAPSDLCAYGYLVHGEEAPIMAQLATAPHVRIMANAMEKHPLTMFVTPPEHGKSTIMRWALEQWIGNQTEKHFAEKDVSPPSAVLVMNTVSQAMRQCMTIAATIESNSNYRNLYPHVRADPKWGWTKDMLYVKRRIPRPDPTLMAVGMFGAIQGARFGYSVIDDPTDQNDARSDKIMTAQKEWLQGELADRMLETAVRRNIATRWSKKDPSQMYLDADQWHSEVMPVLGYWEAHPEHGRNSRELWPEVWPESRLDKVRAEKEMVRDSGLWQLTYMCNPVASEGNLFLRQWLRYDEPPEAWLDHMGVAA